jgi:predicted DNA-binding transcriptional regulator AlpA|tara:strand:- start:805 stop:984 length:180 start_codon:yes stop_codon:yes gene_type:complete
MEALMDTLLNEKQVSDVVGFKKRKLYQMIDLDLFPRPVEFGSRMRRWKKSEIQKWVEEL